MKYRPEIDGLRAIAVLAVVIYHGDFAFQKGQFFSGGFFGVDIFFVISGYLITFIVLREALLGQFKFARFYERRARRIIPALLTVMIATIPFAWFLLVPEAMKEYGASAVSSLLFSSNFWFLSEDSYLAEASALKPFLHTWSLSVEEQFYLLFPISIILILRFARAWLLPILLAFFALSFGLAVYGSQYWPEAAFYMLHTRGWELLAGAILAKIEVTRGEEKTPLPLLSSPTINGLLVVVGLVLIGGAIWFIDDKIDHPSTLTLIPVLGTVLIIWFARGGRLSSVLLGNRLFISIGLVSYSFYLWHFPVFAFARIHYNTLTDTQKIACILLSFILAIVSYFAIEKPFRGRRFGLKTFSVSTSVVFVTVAALFFNFHQTNGANYRLNKESRQAYRNANISHWSRLIHPTSVGRSLQNSKKRKYCYMRNPLDACQFGNGKWVTIGDSYAGSYNVALLGLLKAKGDGIIDMSYSRCTFVNEIWFSNTICILVNRNRWKRIAAFTDKKTIILTMNDNYITRGKEATADPLTDFQNRVRRGKELSVKTVLNSYHDNIRKLLKLGHNVVLITSLPKPRESVRGIYFQQLIAKSYGWILPEIGKIFNKSPKEYERLVKLDKMLLMEEYPNLIQITPREIFCLEEDNRRCQNLTADGPVYSSAGHLSVMGAEMVLEKVFEEFDRRGLSN